MPVESQRNFREETGSGFANDLVRRVTSQSGGFVLIKAGEGGELCDGMIVQPWRRLELCEY